MQTVFGDFYQVFIGEKPSFLLAIYELIDSEYVGQSVCRMCIRILVEFLLMIDLTEESSSQLYTQIKQLL